MMNKKGSMMLAVLFAIAYFIIGMTAFQFLKPDIAIQRNADHMNCTGTTSSGDKMICLILDGTVPMVILGILATAGGIITKKVIT